MKRCICALLALVCLLFSACESNVNVSCGNMPVPWGVWEVEEPSEEPFTQQEILCFAAHFAMAKGAQAAYSGVRLRVMKYEYGVSVEEPVVELTAAADRSGSILCRLGPPDEDGKREWTLGIGGSRAYKRIAMDDGTGCVYGGVIPKEGDLDEGEQRRTNIDGPLWVYIGGSKQDGVVLGEDFSVAQLNNYAEAYLLIAGGG